KKVETSMRASADNRRRKDVVCGENPYMICRSDPDYRLNVRNVKIIAGRPTLARQARKTRRASPAVPSRAGNWLDNDSSELAKSLPRPSSPITHNGMPRAEET